MHAASVNPEPGSNSPCLCRLPVNRDEDKLTRSPRLVRAFARPGAFAESRLHSSIVKVRIARVEAFEGL
jgi:hypothetical protein